MFAISPLLRSSDSFFCSDRSSNHSSDLIIFNVSGCSSGSHTLSGWAERCGQHSHAMLIAASRGWAALHVCVNACCLGSHKKPSHNNIINIEILK